MNRFIETEIQTPLGPMVAICDELYLYILEFKELSHQKKQKDKLFSRLSQEERYTIDSKPNAISKQLENELKSYFSRSLKQFHTPIAPMGTPFQTHVWTHLRTIPYGETLSYLRLAQNLGHPNSSRAVANANGANPLAILVPCHRVIYQNGELGGYAGGLERKRWLLQQESGLGLD